MIELLTPLYQRAIHGLNQPEEKAKVVVADETKKEKEEIDKENYSNNKKNNIDGNNDNDDNDKN